MSLDEGPSAGAPTHQASQGPSPAAETTDPSLGPQPDAASASDPGHDDTGALQVSGSAAAGVSSGQGKTLTFVFKKPGKLASKHPESHLPPLTLADMRFSRMAAITTSSMFSIDSAVDADGFFSNMAVDAAFKKFKASRPGTPDTEDDDEAAVEEVYGNSAKEGKNRLRMLLKQRSYIQPLTLLGAMDAEAAKVQEEAEKAKVVEPEPEPPRAPPPPPKTQPRPRPAPPPPAVEEQQEEEDDGDPWLRGMGKSGLRTFSPSPKPVQATPSVKPAPPQQAASEPKPEPEPEPLPPPTKPRRRRLKRKENTAGEEWAGEGGEAEEWEDNDDCDGEDLAAQWAARMQQQEEQVPSSSACPAARGASGRKQPTAAGAGGLGMPEPSQAVPVEVVGAEEQGLTAVPEPSTRPAWESSSPVAGDALLDLGEGGRRPRTPSSDGVSSVVEGEEGGTAGPGSVVQAEGEPGTGKCRAAMPPGAPPPAVWQRRRPSRAKLGPASARGPAEVEVPAGAPGLPQEVAPHYKVVGRPEEAAGCPAAMAAALGHVKGLPAPGLGVRARHAAHPPEHPPPPHASQAPLHVITLEQMTAPRGAHGPGGHGHGAHGHGAHGTHGHGAHGAGPNGSGVHAGAAGPSGRGVEDVMHGGGAAALGEAGDRAADGFDGGAAGGLRGGAANAPGVDSQGGKTPAGVRLALGFEALGISDDSGADSPMCISVEVNTVRPFRSKPPRTADGSYRTRASFELVRDASDPLPVPWPSYTQRPSLWSRQSHLLDLGAVGEGRRSVSFTAGAPPSPGGAQGRASAPDPGAGVEDGAGEGMSEDGGALPPAPRQCGDWWTDESSQKQARSALCVDLAPAKSAPLSPLASLSPPAQNTPTLPRVAFGPCRPSTVPSSPLLSRGSTPLSPSLGLRRDCMSPFRSTRTAPLSPLHGTGPPTGRQSGVAILIARGNGDECSPRSSPASPTVSTRTSPTRPGPSPRPSLPPSPWPGMCTPPSTCSSPTPEGQALPALPKASAAKGTGLMAKLKRGLGRHVDPTPPATPQQRRGHATGS